MALPLQPVRSVPLRTRVFDTLRDAILTGQLKPDEALPELRLARELDVSQAPIREALLKLEHVGLVTRVPNKGAAVTELSLRELRERMDVRAWLEEVAFVQAAQRMGEEAFDALRARYDELHATLQADKHFEISRADLRFHQHVWACSGNAYLAETLTHAATPLFAFISIAPALYRSDIESLKRSVESHLDLIDALRSRDAERVRRVLRRHLQDGTAFKVAQSPLTSDAAEAAAQADGRPPSDG